MFSGLFFPGFNSLEPLKGIIKKPIWSLLCWLFTKWACPMPCMLFKMEQLSDKQLLMWNLRWHNFKRELYPRLALYWVPMSPSIPRADGEKWPHLYWLSPTCTDHMWKLLLLGWSFLLSGSQVPAHFCWKGRGRNQRQGWYGRLGVEMGRRCIGEIHGWVKQPHIGRKWQMPTICCLCQPVAKPPAWMALSWLALPLFLHLLSISRAKGAEEEDENKSLLESSLHHTLHKLPLLLPKQWLFDIWSGRKKIRC